jgi:hypothetical protein
MNMADTMKTKTLAPADGGAAFPTSRVVLNGQDALDGVEIYGPGMTLRDWFAGQALAGMLAMPSYDNGNFHDNCGEPFAGPAGYAYRMADAMIAARKAGA